MCKHQLIDFSKHVKKIAVILYVHYNMCNVAKCNVQ